MDVKFEGDKMIITLDVSKKAIAEAPPSSTGKRRNVATSHGFSNYATPNGEISLSLNLTTK